jgi:membrane protein required for colicin V production
MTMGSLDLGGLNAFDIVLLVIFFISVIIGFGRGFVSEVLSLVILIAAFVVAIMFTNSLSAYFANSAAVHGAISQTSTATGTNTAQSASYITLGISFAVLFIGTLIVGLLLKMFLNLLMGAGLIGFGNRILGAIFGAIRGVLLDLALVFIIQLSPLTKEPWWEQSHYVPYFQPYIEKLGHVVSPALSDLKSSFSSAVENLGSSPENKTPEDKTTMTITPPTSPASQTPSTDNTTTTH